MAKDSPFKVHSVLRCLASEHRSSWKNKDMKPSSVCWAVCWGQRILDPSHFTFWASSTLCRRNWESKKSQFAQGQKVEICEANILEADLFYSPGSPIPPVRSGKLVYRASCSLDMVNHLHFPRGSRIHWTDSLPCWRPIKETDYCFSFSLPSFSLMPCYLIGTA